MTAPPPIPAATLVLFRAGDHGAPELLMVERAGGMAFAAGALVFPGGRVDPDDHALAASFPAHDGDEAAARIAAIRETLEESGLPIGFAHMPDAEETSAMRAALAAGEAFSAILARRGHALDPEALTPWARWCPNFKEARSFDTRFYIARLPAGSPAATVDETENVHLFWASAQTVLDMVARGEAKAIFPTRRNLERLALFADFDGAASHATNIPIRLIQPWVEPHPDGDLLRIPDDQGYPVTTEPVASARRF
ncbi:NUDIX domain-containing protein [Sphingobium boeckii]|uniref:8-oxo-dGTP pyrophosphatase MutT (NUDIX family) n=1 Tax=Sphingobium boeckii TaxID=1082345 RepID=A0A7W9AL93_9SPHN|nr:NUDIX domain-containing protein [Sphingobium boeckii]MBB5687522.1 8-oxo-dGTP pyrophosphatase MutT (NUDIX family) [Sphingobium boeckii]